MKHKHDQHLKQKIAEQLSENFDARLLEEVAEHMRDCPDCRIYVDSVKQTIKLYRVTETEKSVPEEVSERLFKVLKLTG